MVTILGLTAAGCQADNASTSPTTTEETTTTLPASTTTTSAVTTEGVTTTPATTGPPPARPAADPVPVDMLNPAVTQATISTTICVAGYTATIRPPTSVTNRIKIHQIGAYGYGNVTPGSFEEDHVIPLEVGGAAAAPANLYPEPLATAGQDDALENSLHRQVCSGAVTLAAAQAQLLAAKSAHGYARATSVT